MFSKRSITEFVFRIHPWSLQALAFAVVAVGVATALRMGFAAFGATLYFAPFFPSVLLASVFAGVPAGALTAALSLGIVWWAFLPPPFSFSHLTQSDVGNFSLFLVSALLMVWLSSLYRNALRTLLAAESARELLINELNHRAGNVLAVVQAIVNGTVVGDKSTAKKLSERIGALARVSTLIAKSAEGTISLKQIMQNETAPYVYSGERIDFQGTEFLLSARAARSVAMVLHELITNAAKYGALSNEAGMLKVNWIKQGERCSVFWRETGGPAVTNPTRAGFGTRMMRASLATIDGSFESDFQTDGFSCVVTFSTRPLND